MSPCATTWTRVSVCSLKRYGSRSLRKRRPSSSGTSSAKGGRGPGAPGAADFRRYLALAPQGGRAEAAARYLTQLEAAAGP